MSSKISSSEYNAVISYFKKLSNTKFPLLMRAEFARLASASYNLASLPEATCRRLQNALPSGHTHILRSPHLHSVRQKCKTALKYMARPHLDPDHWPKVFRKINNNSRAGLRDFGGGQLGVLNDKAMAMPLNGTFSWNEKKFGELIVMGPWSNISEAIGSAGRGLEFKVDFGDIYAGDVNVEFDRMYRDEDGPKDDMGIVVSYLPGAAFGTTDEEGEVVLDPRGELVELGAGAVAGIAGAGAQLKGALEVAGLVKDGVDLAGKMKDNFGVKLTSNATDKDKYTFVVSLFAVGDYRSRNTGEKSISGSDFLDICKGLARI